MVRLVKKPTKRIIKLCKKYRVKVTIKKGTKRVYKSKRVLMKQLRRKIKSKGVKRKVRRTHHRVRRTRRTRRTRFGSSNAWNPASFGTVASRSNMFGKKRRSRFGECGCNKVGKSMFGKRKRKSSRKLKKGAYIRKLHKLCKIYKVKIGKKKPETLRKQCLKKAMKMLKMASRKRK